MSLEIVTTGEVVEEMTRVEAERITSRIADKLDTIADNLEQVLPLIGEALTREAWKVLDYASPTAYVSERFAGALTRLPVEVRRPVVAQLSAAGMSTRAIAPIVGKSHPSIVNDLKISGGQELTTSEAGSVDEPATPESVFPKADKITGNDGKEYKRPGSTDQKPRAESITSQFTSAVVDLNKVLSKLHRIRENKNFDRNTPQIAELHRSDIERAISELQTTLNQINQ